MHGEEDSRRVFFKGDATESDVMYSGQVPGSAVGGGGASWQGMGGSMIFLWHEVFSELEKLTKGTARALPAFTTVRDGANSYDALTGFLTYNQSFANALNVAFGDRGKLGQGVENVMKRKCRFCVHFDADIAFPGSVSVNDCGLPGHLLGLSAKAGGDGGGRVRQCTQVLGAIPFGGSPRPGSADGMVSLWGGFSKFMIQHQYSCAYLVAVLDCLQNKKPVDLVVAVPEGVDTQFVIEWMQQLQAGWPMMPIFVHVQKQLMGGGGSLKKAAKEAGPPPPARRKSGVSSGDASLSPRSASGVEVEVGEFADESASVASERALYEAAVDSIMKDGVQVAQARSLVEASFKAAKQLEKRVEFVSSGGKKLFVGFSVEKAYDDGNCFYRALYLALKHNAKVELFVKSIGLLGALCKGEKAGGVTIVRRVEFVTGGYMERLYSAYVGGVLLGASRQQRIDSIFSNAPGDQTVVDENVRRLAYTEDSEETFFVGLLKNYLSDLLRRNDPLAVSVYNQETKALEYFLVQTQEFQYYYKDLEFLRDNVQAVWGPIASRPYAKYVFGLFQQSKKKAGDLLEEYRQFRAYYTTLWGMYAAQYEVLLVKNLMQANPGGENEQERPLMTQPAGGSGVLEISKSVERALSKEGLLPSQESIVLYLAKNHYDWIKFDLQLAFGV